MPDDSSSPPAYTLTFFQLGPVLRVFLFVLLAAVGLFNAAMSVWMTEDSWLACAREAGGARCSVRSEYALGIASVEPLPLIAAARSVQRMSHDKYGDHPYQVLLLEPASGKALEFPGVGEVGVRAEEVARGVSGLIAGEASGSGRWHLRESSALAAGFELVLGLGMFVAAFGAFRRTQLALDPITRVLTVRRGRWPIWAKTMSAPLADVEGCEMTRKVTRSSAPTYRVGLKVAGEVAFPLGILGQVEADVQSRMDAVEQQLAVWRQSA